MVNEGQKQIMLLTSIVSFLGMVASAILVFMVETWWELLIIGLTFVVFLSMIFIMPKIILGEEYEETEY